MLRSLVRAALARLREEDAVLSTGLAVAACLPEPVLGGSRRHGCSPPSWEKVGLDRRSSLVSRSGWTRPLRSPHCSNSSDRLWGNKGSMASRRGSWLSSLSQEGVWRPSGGPELSVPAGGRWPRWERGAGVREG